MKGPDEMSVIFPASPDIRALGESCRGEEGEPGEDHYPTRVLACESNNQRLAAQRPIGHAQTLDADVMQKRREPRIPVLARDSAHTLQRT